MKPAHTFRPIWPLHIFYVVFRMRPQVAEPRRTQVTDCAGINFPGGCGFPAYPAQTNMIYRSGYFRAYSRRASYNVVPILNSHRMGVNGYGLGDP